MVIFAILVSLITSAQVHHELIRRIAVFPIKTDQSELKEVAEDAWWRMRSRLTDDQRFLIASRHFMIQRDVFQPRGALTPADAVILGKLLDAHALIITYLENRRLHMVTYDARNSLVLWSQSLPLNRNRKSSDQLVAVTERLINDFISAIPYQGFQIKDYRYNQMVFEDGSRKLTRIQIPADFQGRIGDPVQWIKIENIAAKPIFELNEAIRVIDTGKIVAVREKDILVEVRSSSGSPHFFEGAMVRLPGHAKSLNSRFAINKENKLSADIFIASNKQEKVDEDEASMVTALSFIANLVIFILMAF